MEEQARRTKQTILHLYDQILPVLAQQVNENLIPVIQLFEDFVLERLLDTWTKDPAGDSTEEISLEKGNVQQLGLRLRLEGFNKPGVEPFDITKSLIFRLEYSSYTVGTDKNSNWLEKEYLQRWEKSEYQMIAEKWTEELVEEIMRRLPD